ncbi:MAG: hypothetical protein M3R41_04205 [Pseudomonadota bacterium]|nr:hypothetical protein [Pseudomonadota bacterium]
MWGFVIAILLIGMPWLWIAAIIVARTPVTRKRFWIEFPVVGVLAVLPIPIIGTGASGGGPGAIIGLALVIYVAVVAIFAVLWAIFRAVREPTTLYPTDPRPQQGKADADNR